MAPIRRTAPAAAMRPRADGDFDECVRLLEVVHEVDGYPTYWPENPARWLSPRAMLGSWVAEGEGRIVGHVALAGSSLAVAQGSLKTRLQNVVGSDNTDVPGVLDSRRTALVILPKWAENRTQKGD